MAKENLEVENLEVENLEVENLKNCSNPFNEGVSYAEFLETIGKKTVDEALKDICTKEQIEFIKNELKTLKNL